MNRVAVSPEVLAAMTVNETIRCYPATVEVFNRHGIDACCGGAAPVLEAALRDGAEGAVVLEELQAVIGGTS